MSFVEKERNFVVFVQTEYNNSSLKTAEEGVYILLQKEKLVREKKVFLKILDFILTM